jgi:hypothetical protein
MVDGSKVAHYARDHRGGYEKKSPLYDSLHGYKEYFFGSNSRNFVKRKSAKQFRQEQKIETKKLVDLHYQQHIDESHERSEQSINDLVDSYDNYNYQEYLIMKDYESYRDDQFLDDPYYYNDNDVDYDYDYDDYFRHDYNQMYVNTQKEIAEIQKESYLNSKIEEE